MNMKIGILTWLRYGNYGTALQAYALNRYLTKLGHTVVNIDYVPKREYMKPILERYFGKGEFKKKIYNRLFITDDIRKYFSEKSENVFSFLQNNISISDECFNDTDLLKYNDYFDKFICGSDQIWNPNNFDDKFFLTFIDNPTKLISYAPSFGTSSIPENLKTVYAKMISRFPNLSVRELEGKKIVNDLCNIEAKVVCDPTLLLEKEDYNDIIKNNEIKINIKEKYILCYFLSSNKKYMKLVTTFAQKNNCRIVIIPSTVNDFKNQNCIKNQVGVPDFLNLIKNAEYVCTDSYHGMIFSKIFLKKLLAFKRFKSEKNNQNSRIYTLFELLKIDKKNLIDETKSDISNYVISSEIEINNVFINFSKKFLADSLGWNSNKKYDYKITKNCTGCSLCVNVCPKEAISIEMNQQGFFEARVNQELCIRCKKCRSVCPTVVNDSKNVEEADVFYYRIKDEKKLIESASGGIASSILNYCKMSGMNVISCLYNSEKHIAEHVVMCSNEDNDNLNRYKKSKYLQSYCGEAFRNIENLDNGLIIALPCQVAALDHYLRKINKRDNFILVDLICHGVPTYNLWKKYLQNLENFNLDDKEIDFRHKTINNDFAMYVNKNNVFMQDEDLFYKFFKLYNCYMRSCYDCNYRISSNSDIRIGDYWGEKFENQKGTSIVLTMTEKGKDLFNKVVNQYECDYGTGAIQDYFNHQQIDNVNVPSFYYELLERLEGNEDLKNISKEFCDPYYKLDKLKKIIRRK